MTHIDTHTTKHAQWKTHAYIKYASKNAHAHIPWLTNAQTKLKHNEDYKPAQRKTHNEEYNDAHNDSYKDTHALTHKTIQNCTHKDAFKI